MSGPAGPDWGSPGADGDLRQVEGASPEERFLDELAFDAVLDDWPTQKAPARKAPIDITRGALVDAPGKGRRLTPKFDDVDRALEMAAVFAQGDPAELVPAASGYYQALPVYDEAERVWQIIARYVEPGANLYPDFQTWMVEWLAPTIHRPLRGGVVWCPEWWRHAEAVARLDALWRAWESARLEGGAGMAFWWDMHFDSHWAALTSDRGPFAACKDKVHASDDKKLGMLPCEPPPENWPWPSDQKDSA